MRKRSTVLFMGALIGLGGCSTDRHFRASHDDVVRIATEVTAEEAHVRPEEVKVSEVREGDEGRGGRRTCLRAKYMEYSDVEVNVVSKPWSRRGKPELEVKVTTDKILYTRHTDWEKRIIEKVSQRLPRLKKKPVAATAQGASATAGD